MIDKLSRREALQVGAAMLRVAGSALASSSTITAAGNQEKVAPVLSEFNRYGEDLERMLILRTSPIAVKMLATESDIPKGAVRPKRDRKYHLAQCQAFALSRREGLTIAMLKEDNWCPTAVMAYGLVKRPESVEKWSHPYDCFEPGKYIGIVSAPLKAASFMPDVVIIYAKPAQLRGLLLSLRVQDVPIVKGHFFPPSCAWSVVNPMKTGDCWVVMPDPGEYQRALTDEGDLMFSVPQSRMPALMEAMRKNEHGPFSYREHHMFIQPDFPLPDFYKEMFKSWGMDTQ